MLDSLSTGRLITTRIPEVGFRSMNMQYGVLKIRTAYLQTIQNRPAVCDRCVQRITGEWFRCVYCPKDLCEECEALDSHDPTHLFIVFKSVVDTALLRYVYNVLRHSVLTAIGTGA